MQKAIGSTPREKLQNCDSKWFRELRVSFETKPLVVYKCLLSKALYTSEQFSEEEEVALFTAFETVEKLISQDPGFKERYFWLYYITSDIFKNLHEFLWNLEDRAEKREFLSGYFSYGRKQLSAEIYFGLKLQYTVEMVSKQPRKPKAKRRIAVGYRDKGTAKDLAWNGHCSWQEWTVSEQGRQLVIEPSSSDRLEDLHEMLRRKTGNPWENRRSYSPTSFLVRKMKG